MTKYKTVLRKDLNPGDFFRHSPEGSTVLMAVSSSLLSDTYEYYCVQMTGYSKGYVCWTGGHEEVILCGEDLKPIEEDLTVPVKDLYIGEKFSLTEGGEIFTRVDNMNATADQVYYLNRNYQVESLGPSLKAYPVDS